MNDTRKIGGREQILEWGMLSSSETNGSLWDCCRVDLECDLSDYEEKQRGPSQCLVCDTTLFHQQSYWQGPHVVCLTMS